MTRRIVWEGDTDFGYYQVVDTLYDGRAARVLYSGDGSAAQSGIPKDGLPDMLFDYNQRLYELICALRPGKILIIGGGACTLATALLNQEYITKLDIVEPNAQLSKIAYEYFDLPVDDRLRIFHTDGMTYLNSNITKYDIVLLDAFTHMDIPPELKTTNAFELYRNAVGEQGALLANIISMYHGVRASPLTVMVRAAQEQFKAVELFRASNGYSLWLPQNFVLVAYDNYDGTLQKVTRGIPIELP